VRESDGVGFGFGAVSPAIEDDEDERFRTRHGCVFHSCTSYTIAEDKYGHQ
jgi:hypothetical protein